MNIVEVDSFYEWIEKMGKDKEMVIDDNHNTYIIVQQNGNIIFGIAYCNYGISEKLFYDEKNRIVYVGAGERIICVDMSISKIILNYKLSSIFYDFITNANDTKVIVVCELDICCYSKARLEWKMEFREIIKDVCVEKSNILRIVCEDNYQLYIDINDGKCLS